MSGVTTYEGVVDISDERFVFDITVPETGGLPWELVCFTNREIEWRHFVRIEGDGEGGIRARVGKRLRGVDSAATGVNLQVRCDTQEVHLTLDSNGWATNPLAGFVSEGKLTLILLISPEFRESNEYLARKLTVPPTTLKNDLAWLLRSGKKADIIVNGWETAPFQFHSTIVDCRRVQRFIRKRHDDWWPKTVVPFLPLIKGFPDHEEMRAFIHYIYTDELPDYITPFLAQRLLFFGHEYKIPRLKALCALYLAENMTAENISATFSYSLDYRAPELTQVVHDYLLVPSKRLGTTQHLIFFPELFEDSLRLVQYHDMYDTLITGLKQACLYIVQDDENDNVEYIVAAKNLIKALNDPSYCF